MRSRRASSFFGARKRSRAVTVRGFGPGPDLGLDGSHLAPRPCGLGPGDAVARDLRRITPEPKYGMGADRVRCLQD